MTVITHAQAEAEFEAAVQYYESQKTGLGAQFRNEVAQSIEWIRANPEVLRIRRGGYRRFNLHKFPHYIAYVSEAPFSGLLPSDTRVASLVTGWIGSRHPNK